MKTALLALLLALAAPPVTGDDARTDSPPEVSITLRLPDTGLDLTLRHRQILDDLAPYLHAEGADALAIRRLQVQAVLAQGIELATDVEIKVGERVLPAGTYPLAFTVDRGEVRRWILVTGEEAIDVPSEPVEMPFAAPRLTITPRWVDRREVVWLWHLGDRAGLITTKLGEAR